jgi:hypothetical protein
MKNYDYVIIGGGISGIVLAYYLSKFNYNVVILEKNDSLGGCHYVKRVNGLFTEHAPRVYFDNYIMFIEVLKDMNINFFDIFKKYNYSISNYIKKLSFFEQSVLFFYLLTLNDSYKYITVKDVMNKYEFSKNSIEFINRLCLKVDGVDSSKYSIYSLIDIFNKQFLFSMYEPNIPNDIGLFKLLENKLIENKVDISINSSVNKIIDNNTISYYNNFIEYKIYSKYYIFSIPPINLINILKNNNLLQNIFGNYDDLYKWGQITNYFKFISLTFHWNKILPIEKYNKNFTTSTPWAINYIVNTDYMNLNDNRSQTVISLIISNNEISNYTNKTPNQTSNKHELINETFRQLKLIIPNLEYPTYVLVNNDYIDNKWEPHNTAFGTVASNLVKSPYINYKSQKFNNFYTCGCHIGLSKFNYTTMESAVCNSLELLNILIPEFNKNIKYSFSLLELIYCIFFILLIYIIINIIF